MGALLAVLTASPARIQGARDAEAGVRINEEQLGAGFRPPRDPHLISLAKRACFTSDSAYRAMLELIAEELGPKSPAAKLLALFESHRNRARKALA